MKAKILLRWFFVTKKVLIITHAGGSSQLGPNARWARFAKGLRENDISLTVVGASFFHKYRNIISAQFLSPCESKADDLDFIHIWSPRYTGSIKRLLNQLIFSISIFLLSKKRLTKINPDFVIASSPHPFVVFGAYFWACRLGADFVYESRDLWPKLLNQHFGMSKLSPYSLMCSYSERFAISRAKFVITPKQKEFEYYCKYYDFNRVYWIPNTSKRQSKKVPLQAKSHSINTLTILYSGSLDTIYLIDELIKAVRILKDIKLEVLILGEGRKKEYLRNLSEGKSNINFIGWANGDAYIKYLATADVCFFGTTSMAINKYGFSSNKISDYLSFGKPILTHCIEGIDHLVSNGVALQSNPGDIKCLAGNIKKLYYERQRIDDMSKKARDYYDEYYDYDSVVEKLTEVFK